MLRFIQGVLYNFEYEQQAYNTLNGILHQCDHVPNGIAKQAAVTCLKEGKLTLRYFKYQIRVLSRQEDRTDQHENPAEKTHQNIRGKEYYQ